jgi:hypothetical protein
LEQRQLCKALTGNCAGFQFLNGFFIDLSEGPVVPNAYRLPEL